MKKTNKIFLTWEDNNDCWYVFGSKQAAIESGNNNQMVYEATVKPIGKISKTIKK